MRLKFISSFLFLSMLLAVLTGCSKEPGKYDSFAQCLTEKGAVMYGTEWCSHCKNQKKMFGISFKYVDYVDCDRDGGKCLKQGIRGYPTWKINETNYPGEQPLYRLGYLTGCKLN